MDIRRPELARRKRTKRITLLLLALVAIAGVTFGLSRLEPAAPRVESATVYVDTVKRGEMVREVRGLGRLVPEEIRWIPATTDGLVDRILVQPGVVVTPDTILVELSNPELEQTTLDAELQIRAEEAEQANLEVQLASDLLTQQAGAAGIEAEAERAKLQYEADNELAGEGLISNLNLNLSRVEADHARRRFEFEQQRLQIVSRANEAQMVAQRTRVDQLKAVYDLRKDQLERLRVRAGIGGVLQLVAVGVGQRLTPGTNIARVAEPTRLKAELQIAETQAKDVLLGQSVAIDTRNGVIPGAVSRIDPAVQNGTVLVDVRLLGDLPLGARPDLSVDGIIEIERLEDVLYVARPAYGQAGSLVGMFRLTADGHAVRSQVRLGRTSVSTIEIINGLEQGDQVILSDMSNWDEFDRVRLN